MELLPQSTRRSHCAAAGQGGPKWNPLKSVFAYAKAHKTTPSHKAGGRRGLHFTDINIYIS